MKVGYTDRYPDARARELETTGVPGRLTVVFGVGVEDARELEARVHRALLHVHANKEWFRCTKERAIQAILDEIGDAAFTAWGNSGSYVDSSPFPPGHPLKAFYAPVAPHTGDDRTRTGVSFSFAPVRPIDGEMTHVCRHCGREWRIPAFRLFHCTYCGKTDQID